MPKLYQLADDLETAYQLMSETIDEETGEINPDALELLNQCKLSFDEKISGVVEFVKRLSSDYEAYKAEELRLSKFKKTTEKKIEWLKSYIKDCLVKAGKDKVETISCKVSLGTSHAVNILDVNQIPNEYKTIEQTIKVDKKALTDIFKSGQVVPGAEYIDNINLRIK